MGRGEVRGEEGERGGGGRRVGRGGEEMNWEEGRGERHVFFKLTDFRVENRHAINGRQTRKHTHICTHTNTQAHTNKHTHIHVYMHKHMHTVTHTNTHTHTHIHIYMHTVTHTYTYTCTNTCTHKHTVTHTDEALVWVSRRL